MRSAFMVLTASLFFSLMAGSLSAQTVKDEDFPTQLVPKNVETSFFSGADKTEGAVVPETTLPAIKFVPPRKLGTRSRFLGSGSFSAEPRLNQETPSEKKATVTTLGKKSPIQQVAGELPGLEAQPFLPAVETAVTEEAAPVAESGSNPFEAMEALPTVTQSDFTEEAAAPQSEIEQVGASLSEAQRLFGDGPAAEEEIPFVADKTEVEAAPVAPIDWDRHVVSGPISPTVTTRWACPRSVNVGQKSDCQLKIRNTGASTVHDVEINAQLPAHLDLIGDLHSKDNKFVWNIDELKSGEEKVYTIEFVATQSGPVNAQARVRFSAMTASTFTVEEPMLKLALKGPDHSSIGKPITQEVTVSNPGTSVAKNVIVETEIPKGLKHVLGNTVKLEIGSLNPGEKRTLSLPLACIEGGTHEFTLTATADGDLKEEAAASIHVVAPQLKLAAKGPRLRYVGRTATYELTVTNDGTAASSNVRLLHKLPKGFDFVRANQSGKHNNQQGITQWFVGVLEPGQSRTVQIQLEATTLGKAQQHFAAVSDEAERVGTTVNTEVDGTASLVMEVVDLDDPVEVGRETAYEIRIRNEGSKASEQVGLTCAIPAGLSFMKAEGPARFQQKGSFVSFQPLAILPAGETATFRVFVKGDSAGRKRFRVQLTSAEEDAALTYEEQTKFYQD